MSIEQKLQIASTRIVTAIETHRPIAVFGLFSGGHDSFSSVYVASGLGAMLTGIVHINTGIGVEATREYVRQTCAERGWKLLEYHAKDNIRADGSPDPQVYEEIVRKHGFPGPAGHGFMYNHLKERALRRLEREFGADMRGKRRKRVMLISGCRSQESERRMAHTDEVQLDGRRIWVAPIHDFSKLDTTETLEIARQPRSEVVDLIHKSGECLCGAFAKPGELAELNLWPQTRPAYEQIVQLQAEITKNHPWGWGTRPPRKPKVCTQQPGMLCWSCDKDGENANE